MTIPAETREPCPLYVLPPTPTIADLGVGYATRGAQLIACDVRRGTGVEALDREHEAEDAQIMARAHRRSFSCRWTGIGCR